jgi:hypothetical protein
VGHRRNELEGGQSWPQPPFSGRAG